jgi:hypothetical protein
MNSMGGMSKCHLFKGIHVVNHGTSLHSSWFSSNQFIDTLKAIFNGNMYNEKRNRVVCYTNK